MYPSTFFCILLFIIGTVKSGAVYNFFLINCANILVKPNGNSFNNLKEALKNCTLNSGCNGVQKISETEYANFNYVFGKPTQNSSTTAARANYPETYLLDRTGDGPILTKAPDLIDAKIFYNIYSDESCPNGYGLDDSECLSSLLLKNIFTEEICGSYPSYMKSAYNSTFGTCSVATKQSIIDALT